VSTGLSDRLAPGSQSFNLIDELLTRHLREGRALQPALIFDSQAITYGDLADRISQTRQLLRAAGVGRGDRVGIVLPDTPAYAYLLLACISLGAIAVPVDPEQELADIVSVLDQVGAKISFCEQTLPRPGSKFHPVSSTLQAELIGFKVLCWRQIVPEATCGSDPVYLLSVCGRDGHRKAIIRRHADNLHVTAALAEDVLQVRDTDRVLATAKPKFGYSLIGSLVGALLFGASSVLLPRAASAESVLEAISRNRPTILLVQPDVLRAITVLMDSRALLNSLRHVISTGDILTSAVRQQWKKKTGLPVIDAFGYPEVGDIFIGRQPAQDAADGSVQPLRGFDLKIINTEGSETPEGPPGRLCIRGPSVSPGYWNDPEQTRRYFGGAWYFSEDLFVRHGELYRYHGRVYDEHRS
jgi:acyl-coenzyme A synthetase/AMP-(fatty) acid ligase